MPPTRLTVLNCHKLRLRRHASLNRRQPPNQHGRRFLSFIWRQIARAWRQLPRRDWLVVGGSLGFLLSYCFNEMSVLICPYMGGADAERTDRLTLLVTYETKQFGCMQILHYYFNFVPNICFAAIICEHQIHT